MRQIQKNTIELKCLSQGMSNQYKKKGILGVNYSLTVRILIPHYYGHRAMFHMDRYKAQLHRRIPCQHHCYGGSYRSCTKNKRCLFTAPGNRNVLRIQNLFKSVFLKKYIGYILDWAIKTYCYSKLICSGKKRKDALLQKLQR